MASPDWDKLVAKRDQIILDARPIVEVEIDPFTGEPFEEEEEIDPETGEPIDPEPLKRFAVTLSYSGEATLYLTHRYEEDAIDAAKDIVEAKDIDFELEHTEARVLGLVDDPPPPPGQQELPL